MHVISNAFIVTTHTNEDNTVVGASMAAPSDGHLLPPRPLCNRCSSSVGWTWRLASNEQRSDGMLLPRSGYKRTCFHLAHILFLSCSEEASSRTVHSPTRDIHMPPSNRLQETAHNRVTELGKRRSATSPILLTLQSSA